MQRFNKARYKSYNYETQNSSVSPERSYVAYVILSLDSCSCNMYGRRALMTSYDMVVSLLD